MPYAQYTPRDRATRHTGTSSWGTHLATNVVPRRYCMDFSIFSDPVVMSLLGKAAAGAVIFLLVIGFIPGVIIGWFVGKAS